MLVIFRSRWYKFIYIDVFMFHTYNIHKLNSIFVIGFLFLCHLKISKNENHLVNICHYYYIKWMLCYVLYDVKSRPTSNYYVYEEIDLGCVNFYLMVYQILCWFNILVIPFNFFDELKKIVTLHVQKVLDIQFLWEYTELKNNFFG